MTDSASVCYRHPSRESWVLCQRCGKTICGECQIPAAVGFHCPDWVREQRPAAARVHRVSRGFLRGRTPGTTGLLIAMGVVFVAQFLLGDAVMYALGYLPALTVSEPWRLITMAFVHSGILHILFNGYSLWVMGQLVERSLGTRRFLTVFAVSVITGGLAVALLSPESFVVGASAGIFGLFSALFVINRGFGGSNVSLLVIVGINLVLGFIVPGVSWQAHIGGLVGG